MNWVSAKKKIMRMFVKLASGTVCSQVLIIRNKCSDRRMIAKLPALFWRKKWKTDESTDWGRRFLGLLKTNTLYICFRLRGISISDTFPNSFTSYQLPIRCFKLYELKELEESFDNINLVTIRHLSAVLVLLGLWGGQVEGLGRCPRPDEIAPCQCRTRGPSIQVR